MIRRWASVLVCFVLCAALLTGTAGAEADLRGYSKEDGYVYVTLGQYPQVIDGGSPDDKGQTWQWRVLHQSFNKNKENKGQKYDPGEVEPTPILWRVLREDEETFFLCSEYILFAAPMDTDRGTYSKTGADFGNTELCRIINSEFAQTAFTEAELDMFEERETFGKIFLLSYQELKDKSLGFGTNKARKAWATEYAIRVTDAFVYQTSMGSSSPYWTRTQRKERKNGTLCTKQDGSVGYYDCTNPEEGIRPAVDLKKESYEITGGSGSKEDPYRLEAR